MAKGIFQNANNAQDSPPLIVFIFYHRISSSVNDSNDISLKIKDITIFYTFIFHKCRLGLSIIEEMKFLGGFISVFVHCSLGQMCNQLTMEGIIVDRGDTVFYNLLLSAQTVVVILKVNLSGGRSSKHICQTPSNSSKIPSR